jgi:hypothetical protein
MWRQRTPDVCCAASLACFLGRNGLLRSTRRVSAPTARFGSYAACIMNLILDVPLSRKRLSVLRLCLIMGLTAILLLHL